MSDRQITQLLRFLRYYVIPNKRDPKRSSLLIEWSVQGIELPVQQWCELGSGHLSTKTGAPMKPGKNGHFRITKGTQLHRWFIDQEILVKKFSEAHSGFKKQLLRTEWAGTVEEVKQKSSTEDGGTKLEIKNRTKTHTVKRIKKTSQSNTEASIPF